MHALIWCRATNTQTIFHPFSFAKWLPRMRNIPFLPSNVLLLRDWLKLKPARSYNRSNELLHGLTWDTNIVTPEQINQHHESVERPTHWQLLTAGSLASTNAFVSMGLIVQPEDSELLQAQKIARQAADEQRHPQTPWLAERGADRDREGGWG